jgi:NAD(P)-dependent dehydrogenase (short-subunit alcohol dehydrogenase family)
MVDVKQQFIGRTYLVTGASSGIGRGIAQMLADSGARVIVNGRRSNELNQVRDSLPGEGHIALARSLGDMDDSAQWIKELAQEFGPLSGFVHSAGIQPALPLKMLKHRHFEESMLINVEAGLGLIKGFRQKGVHTENGSVVFLASVMGILGQPLQSAYCATKGAIIAMTKATALELAKEGIRVNCVAPGIVETEMVDRLKSTMSEEQFQAIRNSHPLGLGTVEDVANAILFLLGEKSRWITGTTLIIDGGYSAQ